MSTGAILFMAGSWAFVLGLMTWSFSRLLSGKKIDPDGVGPALPEPPPTTKQR